MDLGRLVFGDDKLISSSYVWFCGRCQHICQMCSENVKWQSPCQTPRQVPRLGWCEPHSDEACGLADSGHQTSLGPDEDSAREQR